MFSLAPGGTRKGHTAQPLTPWCATDTRLKAGRLFWEQDIGRFDSYVSDDLDLSCPRKHGQIQDTMRDGAVRLARRAHNP
jgi:hypothetical protein